MTEESRELALCLINENTDKFPYAERLELGKRGFGKDKTPVIKWAAMAARFAHHYEHEYGGKMFSTHDVLAAAAQLADYYDTHAKETI